MDTKKNRYKKIFLLNIIFALFMLIFIINHLDLKKIGVIGLDHSQNIGNNLVKYAISIKLRQLGFDPYIIGRQTPNNDISFLQNYTKLKVINNFQEIKETDYDILIVNSDQTWRKWDQYFYDIAFLKFAKNWNKPKFIYAASLGLNTWTFTKEDELIAKTLLKNFTGISLREKGSIKLIESHLGFTPNFVLDPTFLIDKIFYLKLLNNYNNDISIDNSFILIYTVTNSKILKKYINEIKEKFNYNIYIININLKNNIKKFIYGIYNCKAVITDSFHGTIFSLIFNKPFISFVYGGNGRERFNTLKEVFNLKNRIYDSESTPDPKILDIPLNINKNLFRKLKKQSINYLKNNLRKTIYCLYFC